MLIVLQNQPHRAARDSAEVRHSFRQLIVQQLRETVAQFSEASAERSAQLSRAEDDLTVEIRRAALQEIRREIAPLQDSVAAAVQGAGGQVIYGYAAAGNMIAAEMPAEALDKLAGHPEVGEIALNTVLHTHLDVSVPALGVPDSWWNNGSITGAGQAVAVVDTGINANHPAFSGVTVISPQNPFTQSFSHTCRDPNDTGVNDLHGHGTHVAGIIASRGTNTETKALGVARGLTTLYNLKAGTNLLRTLPGCSELENTALFNSNDILAALDWALEQRSLT